jgi:hypothetical protein
MANRQIQISIIDSEWPKLKIIVNRDNTFIREATAQYDIATSQFTPPVADALKFAIDEVVKSHKGGR